MSIVDPLARVIAALEALPTPEPAAAGIPYRAVIPGIARELVKMQRADPSAAARTEAVKKVTRTRTMVEALAAACHELREDNAAMAMLDLPTRLRVIHLASELRELSPATRKAIAPNHGKGAPRKASADAVGLALAQEYERLTGRPPTLSVNGGKANGRFFELIASVFDALGLKASPEAAARRAIKVYGNITNSPIK